MRHHILPRFRPSNFCTAKRLNGRYLSNKPPVLPFYSHIITSRVISTLDSGKLKASDHIDISGTHLPTIAFPGVTQIIDRLETLQQTLNASKHYPVTTLIGFSRTSNTTRLPFPDATRGFLYYHSSPTLPSMSDIRFRLLDAANPDDFEQGTDLMNPYGVPWRIRLFHMTARREVNNFGALLLKDDLVSPSILDKCATINKRASTRIISSLGEPFPINFNSPHITIWMISERNLETSPEYIIRYLLSDHRKTVNKTPYTGNGVVCLEASTLPEHAGTRTVVMRLLKIVQPPICTIPNYNGRVPIPVEGELIRRAKGQVWSRDIDAEMPGLQDLWDPVDHTRSQ